MQLQSWTSVDTSSSPSAADQSVKPSGQPSFSQSLRDFLAGKGDQDAVLESLDRALAAEKSRPLALQRIVTHQNSQHALPEDLLEELSRRISRHLSGDAANDSSPADEPTDDATRVAPAMQAAIAVSEPSSDPIDQQSSDAMDGDVSEDWDDQAATQYLAPEQVPQGQSLPAVGRVLNDRFVLEELVGQGGMSLVYRAIDKRRQEARSRNPYVAVKILEVAAKNKDAAFMALQREVQKSETLYHPNIVRAIDFDRDGDTVFMTLEFLSGQPLSARIKSLDSGGMPVKQAMELIAQMGSALSHAHKHGIIHADFKPGNIMLTDEQEIRVIDFGIARAYQQPDAPEADKTVFDPRSLGALTPAYASPEMLENLEPDPRDDVYSLGCVAYELLTGYHPFSRARATEARDSGAKPRKPEKLTFRQWRALSKALSFERDQRSNSVDELLAGLLPNQNLWQKLVAGVGIIGVGAILYALSQGHLPLGETKPTASDSRSEAEQAPAQITQSQSALTADKPTTEATNRDNAPESTRVTTAPGTIIKDCAHCPELVVLGVGTATLGAAADAPNARAFEGPTFGYELQAPVALGTTEVTIAEYQAFAAANPDQTANSSGCRTLQSNWSPSGSANWRQPGYAQTDTHPVACVSWRDAQNYTAWLSTTTGETYRLPTEAEWEYAARANKSDVTQANYWRDRSGDACRFGNFADREAVAAYPGWSGVNCSDGAIHTAPVAQKQANAFGLFDMQGNLFEWTADCWQEDYANRLKNPAASCAARVLRGGSWFTEPRDLRFAFRNRAAADTRTASFGFRVLREIPQ